MLPEFDDTDSAIVHRRLANRRLTNTDLPRTGDAIRFADGYTGRVAVVWSDGIQPSRGGSFHLAESGGMAYSGSPDRTIPMDWLTLTSETWEVSIWIFHHDYAERDNGVNTTVNVRLWSCEFSYPR